MYQKYDVSKVWCIKSMMYQKYDVSKVWCIMIHQKYDVFFEWPIIFFRSVERRLASLTNSEKRYLYLTNIEWDENGHNSSKSTAKNQRDKVYDRTSDVQSYTLFRYL